jgi:hypothetical protein
MKFLAWIFGSVALSLGIVSFNLKSKNQELRLVKIILEAENKLLKDDVAFYEKKPTYEEGVKDTLIRLGGPDKKGDYQDGWNDATKILGDGSYATGYHNCIQQFGYQQTSTNKWLISKELASKETYQPPEEETETCKDQK